MIRMLIIGDCFGIRSERRLCDEVRLNLAWFCRPRLDAPVRQMAQLRTVNGSETLSLLRWRTSLLSAIVNHISAASPKH
jgi:hypothetical protein